MIKTYYIHVRKSRIREILKEQGYEVKSLATLINEIPYLKENKIKIFHGFTDKKGKKRFKTGYIYKLFFAYKTQEEERKLKSLLEGEYIRMIEEAEKRGMSRNIHWDRWTLMRLDDLYGNIMENVYGKLINSKIKSLI